MKKFLTPEWIRFVIYVIGLFAVGIIAVTNTNATMRDLIKRMEVQESKTVCLETSDILQKTDIEVIKNELANIKDLQKEANSDIKTLLSRSK